MCCFGISYRYLNYYLCIFYANLISAVVALVHLISLFYSLRVTFLSQMRDLAAAEHAKHTLCARDGKRTVYPHITHTAMFTKTGEIVDNMVEIAEILTRKL